MVARGRTRERQSRLLDPRTRARGKGRGHEETDTGQEEIYYAAAGTVDVEPTDRDETVSLEEDELIRLDPEESRQIFNRGDARAKPVLVGRAAVSGRSP